MVRLHLLNLFYIFATEPFFYNPIMINGKLLLIFDIQKHNRELISIFAIASNVGQMLLEQKVLNKRFNTPSVTATSSYYLNYYKESLQEYRIPYENHLGIETPIMDKFLKGETLPIRDTYCESDRLVSYCNTWQMMSNLVMMGRELEVPKEKMKEIIQAFQSDSAKKFLDYVRKQKRTNELFVNRKSELKQDATR